MLKITLNGIKGRQKNTVKINGQAFRSKRGII